MSSATQRGYLLIADISGYTSFVASTELDHAHEILSDLLEIICARIQMLLTMHKLEGDAVFAYAPDARISRGETILELVEATYTAFRDRQSAIQRATTCTCKACRNIPSLDLKFIVHHGDYIIQQVLGIKEMVGSDVNLVHRLLKNHVSEATGWRAYALFTEASLVQGGFQFEDARQLVESYEHLGEVKGCCFDLRARYDALVSERRLLVEEKDADYVMRVDFPTPPPQTWTWLHDPALRNQMGSHQVWTKGERPKGRTGPGASNHCAHGKSLSTQVVVDWRPFDYATMETYGKGNKMVMETMRLEPLAGGGTRVQDNLVIYAPLPRWLRRIIAKFIMTNQFHYEAQLRQAALLAGQEMTKTDGQS